MASIAIDVIKAIAPFWLSEAWKARQLGRGFVSFASCGLARPSVGLPGREARGVGGGREVVNERRRAVKEKLTDVEAQLKAVAGRAVAAQTHRAQQGQARGATVAAPNHYLFYRLASGCDWVLGAR
jgi:hypothetical protein